MMRARLGRLRKRVLSFRRVGWRDILLAGSWGLVVAGAWLWLEPGVAMVVGGVLVYPVALSDRMLRWLS